MKVPEQTLCWDRLDCSWRSSLVILTVSINFKLPTLKKLRGHIGFGLNAYSSLSPLFAYCKFGNFCEGIIFFAKLRKENPLEMANSLSHLLI